MAQAKAKSKRGTDEYIVVQWSVDRWFIMYRGLTWEADGYKRKYEATRIARRIARREKRELVVKTKAGRICDRRSYGRDAKHRPG